MAPPGYQPTQAAPSPMRWRGSHLRKCDHVVAGILHSDFFGTVEGGAKGHYDGRTFQGGDSFVNVADFDVEEGWAFAHNVHAIRIVFFYAVKALIHDFEVSFLEEHETNFVSFRDFNGFFKAQAIHPETDARFDFVDEQNGGDFIDGHVVLLFLFFQLTGGGAEE